MTTPIIDLWTQRRSPRTRSEPMLDSLPADIVLARDDTPLGPDRRELGVDRLVNDVSCRRATTFHTPLATPRAGQLQPSKRQTAWTGRWDP